MTNAEKCEAIVRKIAETVDKDKSITFKQDWGKWSATVCFNNSHTHVGLTEPDGTFEGFVDDLYNLMINDCGLSLVKNEEE